MTDISWAGSGLGCWVVDAGSGWVGLLGPNVKTVIKQYFNSPTAVDAHIYEGWAWVTADSQLIRLYESGTVQIMGALEGNASALSTDYRDGSCWMILETDAGKRIQKIDADGNLICYRDDLNHAANILSDPAGGGCIVADLEQGIVRLSSSGDIISRYSIFYGPLGICRG